MRTFIYEYGLFIVASLGLLFVFLVESTMSNNFKKLSSKYIQIMTGVSVEQAQYDIPDDGS